VVPLKLEVCSDEELCADGEVPEGTPRPFAGLDPDQWTADLAQLSGLKKKYYRRYRKHGLPDDFHTFKLLRNKLKFEISRSIEAKMETLDFEGKIEYVKVRAAARSARLQHARDLEDAALRRRRAQGWRRVGEADVRRARENIRRYRVAVQRKDMQPQDRDRTGRHGARASDDTEDSEREHSSRREDSSSRREDSSSRRDDSSSRREGSHSRREDSRSSDRRESREESQRRRRSGSRDRSVSRSWRK